GADAGRMLLAIEGDAGRAHRLELRDQRVETRDGVGRARRISLADQRLDGGVGQLREIGFAVGGAVEREGLADRRHRAQAMRADHLVDEDEMVLLHRRQIDGLLQIARQLFKMRPRQGDEVAAYGGGEPQDGGAEADSSVRRCGDDQLLALQRGDDALHGRAREVHALGDLAEAEPRVLFFEGAQDRRGARDDLHLTLVVDGDAIHPTLPARLWYPAV